MLRAPRPGPGTRATVLGEAGAGELRWTAAAGAADTGISISAPARPECVCGRGRAVLLHLPPAGRHLVGTAHSGVLGASTFVGVPWAEL